MILGKVLRSELDTRLREMAKDIFPSGKGEKVWKGRQGGWSDEARMRGFGQGCQRFWMYLCRKCMSFIVRANSCERFSHSSLSEFLIFWDALLDGLAHPFPTKLKFSANLQRAFAPCFFLFLFLNFAHWMCAMCAPHVWHQSHLWHKSCSSILPNKKCLSLKTSLTSWYRLIFHIAQVCKAYHIYSSYVYNIWTVISLNCAFSVHGRHAKDAWTNA